MTCPDIPYLMPNASIGVACSDNSVVAELDTVFLSRNFHDADLGDDAKALASRRRSLGEQCRERATPPSRGEFESDCERPSLVPPPEVGNVIRKLFESRAFPHSERKRMILEHS